jgi:hypothetical protein
LYSRPIAGGITPSSVPNSTSVGTVIAGSLASSAASRSEPRSRPVSARCFAATAGSSGGIGGTRSGCAYKRRAISSGVPDGGRCPAGRIAAEPSRISASSRSGNSTASQSPTLAPNDVPSSVQRPTPSAPIARFRVVARSCIDPDRVFSAEPPNPGISNTTTRCVSASSSCERCRRGPPAPCRCTSTGPAPASQ